MAKAPRQHRTKIKENAPPHLKIARLYTVVRTIKCLHSAWPIQLPKDLNLISAPSKEDCLSMCRQEGKVL